MKTDFTATIYDHTFDFGNEGLVYINGQRQRIWEIREKTYSVFGISWIFRGRISSLPRATKKQIIEDFKYNFEF